MAISNQAKRDIEKHLKLRERLELWTGVIGNKMLAAGAERFRKNENARDSFARQQLYQSDEGSTVAEDMGDIYLGDVTTTTTGKSRSASGLRRALVAGLIGAAIPGAGIIGYLIADRLSDKADPVIEKIGLGKITDFNLRNDAE